MILGKLMAGLGDLLCDEWLWNVSSWLSPASGTTS